MNRREIIASLGTVLATPRVAFAQRAKTPVIGFLHSSSPQPFAHLVDAYRKGLEEAGFLEGRNVTIEFRWANGDFDRLPGLATELIKQGVSVVVGAGGTGPAFAAKELSTDIPILFSTGGDPVKLGLVSSLNRPGANITGVNILTAELSGKRLELLREAVPAPLMGVLLSPSSPAFEGELAEVTQAAASSGQTITIVRASNEREIDEAFASLAKQRARTLIVGAYAYFLGRREQIIANAARNAIATIYEQREYALAGGLMSYGTSLADGYRQLGLLTGRILNGAHPSETPVLQSTRFEFVINLRTAKTLGLTVPATLLARADEVIE